MNDEQHPPDSSPTQPWPQPPRQSEWSAGGGHPFGHIPAPPPERGGRPSIWLALVAVGLVIVVVAAAGYVLMLAGPAAPTPTSAAASATPPSATSPPPATTPAATSPSATTPAPTATATGSPPATPTGSPPATPAVGRTPPPEIAAAIDEVTAQIPPLRELEPRGDVPYVLLTRAEAAAELRGALDEEVDVRELAIEERLLQRLGLLPDDASLYDLFVELYTASVAAFYRPDTDTFYVIERGEPFGPLDRMYVAHEYTHALQDQHFDLEGTRITDNAEGDSQLAQLAAVEGDASLVMYLWAFQNLSREEQAELLEDMTPTDQELLERMPPILRRQLSFPYNEGFFFSTQVFQVGGWQRVNETLSNPPPSTEQILHPELYLFGEEVIDVELPDLSGTLGEGWQRAYEQTMGELNTQIWLANGEDPPVVSLPGLSTAWQDAAAGWGGDRLQLYETDDGSWAIVWRTAWDSEGDMAEFDAVAEPLLPNLDGVAQLGSDASSGTPVTTLVVASDQTTLDLLADAVAGP